MTKTHRLTIITVSLLAVVIGLLAISGRGSPAAGHSPYLRCATNGSGLIEGGATSYPPGSTYRIDTAAAVGFAPSFSFTRPGTSTVRLRITSGDGDHRYDFDDTVGPCHQPTTTTVRATTTTARATTTTVTATTAVPTTTPRTPTTLAATTTTQPPTVTQATTTTVAGPATTTTVAPPAATTTTAAPGTPTVTTTRVIARPPASTTPEAPAVPQLPVTRLRNPAAVAAKATTCSNGRNATFGWSICSQMPAGYRQRVRAHYVSSGPGHAAGYVTGAWYGNNVQSSAFHANIDSVVTQTCAGGGCP